MMRSTAWFLLALAACGEPASTPKTQAKPTAETPPAKADAPSEGPDPCAAAEREGGKLRWFHDDYAAALACAKSKSLPIMIDMWAPWCHTCLSMQAYVLTDDRLADYDRRYVFLALDTDRDVNAEIVARYPPAAWPTFFAISSADESIQSRFVGAGSVDQIAQFLDDGERGHMAIGGPPAPAHEAAARDGDRASAAKTWDAAITAYTKALELAPATWTRGPDVMASLLAAYRRAEKWDACDDVVRTYLGRTGNAASASDFASHALGCAEKQTDAAEQKALRESIAQHLTKLVADDAAPLSVDDRSDALMYLREANDALGLPAEAKVAAQRQRALLDDAAAKATDPRVAMTYNWPRAEVYAYLQVPLELVPALEASVKDLPKEYDPPYRLAWIHLKAGKHDDAVRWAEQAIALAYGPRKARAQGLLAEIHHARGDVEAERKARAAALATLEGLPAAAQSPDAIAKAKADLEAVGKTK
jgi:thioredoxin-like negative regulator of GroEL